MASLEPSASPGRWSAQRIGFWLGLVLFVAILSAPLTDGMIEAGGRSLRSELSDEITQELKVRGGRQPPSVSRRVEDYIETHADWFAAESRRRARAMIPAAAVSALVACWWMTVAIPIPATSLIPLVLLPLLGALPLEATAVNYANENIFLFMGGFIIALGIERCGLHRRMALYVVRLIGTGEATIVLGFMVAGAAISMWISNTATTLMMLPIALAVVKSLPELASPAGQPVGATGFGAALMLGIAYACSVGGIGTPIGTPPNIAFMGQMDELFPAAPAISFGEWMIAFVPLVVVFVPVIWLVLTRVTCRLSTPASAQRVGRQVIRDHIRRLGPMKPAERWMLTLFVLTALLWVFRKTIKIGTLAIPGWSDLLERVFGEWFNPAYLDDATVAMGVAVLLFVIPCGRDQAGRRDHLMDWRTAERLPWGILLLFGGGFAIAAAFQKTGLSAYVGQSFGVFAGAPTFMLVIGTCLLLTFLTEVTSNTATTLVMLPIVARAATEAFGVNPLLLMLPATVSASCAFMLPVATPPNAIVFASGHVRMSQMVKSGIVLNFAGVLLVSSLMYFLVLPLLGTSPALPPWAR